MTSPSPSGEGRGEAKIKLLAIVLFLKRGVYIRSASFLLCLKAEQIMSSLYLLQ